MTKRYLQIFGASAVMAAAFSFGAFAATPITSVSFSCGIEEETAISTGITTPIFVLNDANANYELTSYSEFNSSSTAYKTPRTYEISFEALDGYEFPSANEITVTGTGITEITKKTVEDDKTMLTVKCKAYPYYRWEAPEISFGDAGMTEAKKVTWNRPSGAQSEYIISYISQSGEQRYVHSSTSSNSVSLTSYNKKYTGTNTDEYSDAYVEGFAVRIKGNAGDNTRTAPSEWATEGSIDIADVETASYDTWGDLVDGVVNLGSTGGGSSSQSGPGQTMLQGWKQTNDGAWYYYQSGAAVKGWLNDGYNWYYMDPTTGVMQTGWIIYNNKRYYLNPNEGGPKGAMLTGTHTIEGQTVTFDSEGAAQ